MAFIIGKVKCYFCDSKDGVLHSVCHYGCYGDVGKRIFYHDECLQLIEIDPEKFSHIMVDKAIHINELKTQCMNSFNNFIIRNYRKKVEKLHIKNFERMMPRK